MIKILIFIFLLLRFNISAQSVHTYQKTYKLRENPQKTRIKATIKVFDTYILYENKKYRIIRRELDELEQEEIYILSCGAKLRIGKGYAFFSCNENNYYFSNF